MYAYIYIYMYTCVYIYIYVCVAPGGEALPPREEGVVGAERPIPPGMPFNNDLNCYVGSSNHCSQTK